MDDKDEEVYDSDRRQRRMNNNQSMEGPGAGWAQSTPGPRAFWKCLLVDEAKESFPPEDVEALDTMTL